ncbi:MAG: hypothetical protein ACO307_13515 [Ilumatobacteraceae bacterium]
MSLRAALLRYFDNPDLRVGLFLGEREVFVRGYRRQLVPRRGEAVNGRVVFGPFDSDVLLDAIRLLEGADLVETLYRFPTPLALQAGVQFAHDLEIGLL